MFHDSESKTIAKAWNGGLHSPPLKNYSYFFVTSLASNSSFGSGGS